jgi:hypothetical protein
MRDLENDVYITGGFTHQIQANIAKILPRLTFLWFKVTLVTGDG